MGATAQDVLSGRLNTGPGAFRDRVGVRNASDAIADLVTSHEVDIQRVEAGFRRKARNKLRLLEQDLDDQLKRIDPSSPQHVTFRQKRLEKLRKSTRESINNSYVANRKEFKNDLRDFSRAESQAAGSIANKAIGVDLFDVSVSPATLRRVVDGTLIQGTPLNDHWNRQSRRTRERFESQMAIGVLQGEDLGALRRRLRGTHTGKYVTVEDTKGKKKRVGVYEGGIMTTSRREADALIRTATQSVSNRVRDDMILNNADIAKGRQALVTLDGRTSPICIARSGHAWDLEGAPIEGSGATGEFPGPPPWHVNCRSTLVPVLRSWDELRGPKSKLSKAKAAALDKAGRRTQASMDGQVARKLNYEQWLRTKSESFQNRVLGKRKADLWRDGQIKSLSNLVDQTGRPITVEEFRKKAGLPPLVETILQVAVFKLLKRHFGFGDEDFEDFTDFSDFAGKHVNYSAAETVKSGFDTFQDAVTPASHVADFFGLNVLGVPISDVVGLAKSAELQNLATVVGVAVKKLNIKKQPPPAPERGGTASFTNDMAIFRFDTDGKPVLIQREKFRKAQQIYDEMPEVNKDPVKPQPVQAKVVPGERPSSAYFWRAFREVREAYVEGNITPEVQKIVDDILEQSRPLSQGMVVFRGVADKRPQHTYVQNLLKTVKVGDVIDTFGPISTAMNPVYAAWTSRSPLGDDRRVMFVLELEKGQMALLANGRETEVTIPDGYSIRVDEIYRGVEGKVYTPDALTGTVPSATNIIKGTVVKNEEDRIIRTAPPADRPPRRVATDPSQRPAIARLETADETGLFPVQIQNGEKWCGPAVISSLTGTDTVTTANAIRNRKGWLDDSGQVMATSFNDVKEATRELLPKGFVITDDLKPLTAVGRDYIPLHESDVTFTDWMQSSARPDGSYATVVWNPKEEEFHWVAVSKRDGRAFVTDNGALVGTDPVPIESVSAFNTTNRGAQAYGYFRTERVQQLPEQLQPFEDNGIAKINRDDLGRPLIHKYADDFEAQRLYRQSDLYVPHPPGPAQDYFGTGYMSVTTDYKSGFVRKDTAVIADAITDASIPLDQGTLTFRGLHRVEQSFLDNLKPNSILPTWGAPFSTSVEPEMASGFSSAAIPEASKFSVFFILSLRKGQKVLAANEEEFEYTIPEGHSIVVREVHRRGATAEWLHITSELPAFEGMPAATRFTDLGDTVVEADVVKDALIPRAPRSGNAFVDVEYKLDGIPSFRERSVAGLEGYSRDLDEAYFSLPIYVDFRSSENLKRYYADRGRTIEYVERAYQSGDFSDPIVPAMVKEITEKAVPVPEPMVMFMAAGRDENVQLLEAGQIVKAGTGPMNAKMQIGEAITNANELGADAVTDRAIYIIRAERGTPALAADENRYSVVIPEGYALRVDKVHRDVDALLAPASSRGNLNEVPPTVVEATIVKVQASGPVRSRSAADEPIIFSALKEGRNKIVGTTIDINEGEVTYIEIFGASGIQRKTYRKLHRRISGPAANYYSFFYRDVSNAFRTNKFSPEVVEVVQSITKNSRPLPEAQTLFRGMGLPRRVADEYVLGQVLVPLGPFSTSLGLSAGVDISSRRAREITKRGKDGRVVLFAIDAPAGTPYMADNIHELELTIPHGYALKIDKVFDVDPAEGQTEVGGVQIYKMYAASIVPLEGLDPLQATEVEVLDFGGQFISAGDAEGNAIQNAIEAGKSFASAKFNGAAIVETNMDGLDLQKSQFKTATLENVSFLGGTVLQDASFFDASLSDVEFTDGILLDDVSFQKANLHNVLFDGVLVGSVSFTDARLDGVIFQTGVPLNTVSFRNADIQFSKFLGPRMQKTDFSKATIGNTNIETSLVGVIMDSAQVTDSVFDKSDFRTVNFRAATFDNVSFRDTTWDAVNMNVVTVSGSNFGQSVHGSYRTASSKFRNTSFRGAEFNNIKIQSNVYTDVDFSGGKWTGVSIEESLFTRSSFKTVRLENVTITDVSMDGTDFSFAKLNRTTIDGETSWANSKFKDALLFKTTLLGVDMTSADLTKARIESSTLTAVIMDDADLSSAKIQNSDLRRTSLQGANLTKTLFVSVDLGGADFSDTDLTSTVFVGSTNISEAVFDNAKMRGRTLSRVSARGASFRNADLTKANFSGSDLTGADFTGARLEGVDFTGAILDDVVWPKGFDPL